MRERDVWLRRERCRPAVVTACLTGVAALLAVVIGPAAVAGWTPRGLDGIGPTLEDAIGHLVVSEVITGGASASDEFIELYNPASSALPLEGLELVYVTASGATVTRKASWSVAAADIPAGAHLLIANEAGVFASLADVTYANGLAATGGSVALRVVGATAAIDAVGWGTAASIWLEGSAAPAVAAGHSLERLPGGSSGSGHDTDDNAVDFFDQAVPDPQNAAAPPVGTMPSPEPSPTGTVAPTPIATGSATIAPTASPSGDQTPSPATSATVAPTPMPTTSQEGTPSPTPLPSVTPAPTPTATPILTIAEARALPDGTEATIEGVSLTDGAFTDGGGCLVDATAGIAVLVDDGTFPRGVRVQATGTVDDRYQQRTLRTDAGSLVVLDAAGEPDPIGVATGSATEAVECRLVSVDAVIASAATQLSGAVAFEVDDGSGPLRLVVPDASGIDVGAWSRGTGLLVRGVLGQRDSSGTGTSGYRLQLRDPADVLAVRPPATPSPTPSASATGSPTPSADASVVTIAAARQASLNARVRVRGVVTLPTGVLGDGTAAIQDASGAIILRLSDEAGGLAIGELVQVDGMRSTKSGMETLRVTASPMRLGTQPQPAAGRHATGSLGEPQEATLVVVRGAVATAPRRSSAQNVYFDLDDGSGPLRVYVTPGSGIDPVQVASGAWLEITGVLGQETSGQQPERGYRLWPRRAADLRVVSPPAGGTDGNAEEGGDTGIGSGGFTGSHPGNGAGAPGGPGARWPTEIPVPRLAIAKMNPAGATAALSPSLDPAPTAARGGPLSPTLLLVLAAAVLASSAAVVAARPGLLARLRLALAVDAAGHRAEGRVTGGFGGPAVSAIEEPRSGPHLVPLSVSDDLSVPEPAPSTDSRSAVQRILPPT